MSRWVVLLRGINVGGHNKVPMAELREMATGLGYGDVKTYIASGNLLVTTETEPSVVAQQVKEAIETTFGLDIHVVVRTSAQWAEVAKGGIFGESEESRPNLVHVGFSGVEITESAVELIKTYAKNGEEVVCATELWLDYPNGSGRSKITPAVLERAVGAPVTCRNLKTVRKIQSLLG